MFPFGWRVALTVRCGYGILPRGASRNNHQLFFRSSFLYSAFRPRFFMQYAIGFYFADITERSSKTSLNVLVEFSHLVPCYGAVHWCRGSSFPQSLQFILFLMVGFFELRIRREYGQAIFQEKMQYSFPNEKIQKNQVLQFTTSTHFFIPSSNMVI